MTGFYECMDQTALARFHTWGYLNGAYHMMYPRRNWKRNREQALLFLERVRLVLHTKKGELDPIIARDIGGLTTLKRRVQDIDRCIEYIEQKENSKAVDLIGRASHFWLKHALTKFIQCYEGEIQPLDGVSIGV